MLGREKDEETGEIIEHRAKAVNGSGKRVRMVFKTRLGYVSMFLSMRHFEAMNEVIDKSAFFVFVGGLTTQWKNLRTNQYEKVKIEGEEYGKFPSYTFNLWQLVHVVKKGNNINLSAIKKVDE